MTAIYPDDGDREPEAVPQALAPGPNEADSVSITLKVDGELFALRPSEHGGTDYTWLSGPNTGYGFSVSPTRGTSLDEHRENIHEFLAMIDQGGGCDQ